MHLAWYMYPIFVTAYLFIGDLIGRATIKRWKAEVEPYNIRASIPRSASYRLKDAPTIGFWLLFPVTAFCGDTKTCGEPPTANEKDTSFCRLVLLVFWPLKVAFNIIALLIIFLSVLYRYIYSLPGLLQAWLERRRAKQELDKARQIETAEASQKIRIATYGEDLSRLRAARDLAQETAASFDKKIAELESEMVQEQGGDVFRASEALERRRT
ncbi:MAG: hypothetical protein WCW31_05915 [Patescibacteria group bacterium]